MTDKQVIFQTYNLVKDRYIKAATKEDRKIRKEQCYILMHVMMCSHNGSDYHDLWEEYKATHDTTIEKEWYNL